MRRAVLVIAFLFVGGLVGHAQIVVYDGATTLRNSVTAALKEYLLTTAPAAQPLRRMAQRLSFFITWELHVADPRAGGRRVGEQRGVRIRNTAALVAATRRDRVGVTRVLGGGRLGRLTPAARRALMPSWRLWTWRRCVFRRHDTGQLCYGVENWRSGLTGSPTGRRADTTAVLDKISGAVLIGARQRQARAQLLNGVVEQLLVESKRARDTEASDMNMQLVAWRDRQAVNAAFVAGAGDALRAWRQP